MEVLILYREEILLTLELHCNVCIEKYIAYTILKYTAYFRQIVIVNFEEFLWKKIPRFEMRSIHCFSRIPYIFIFNYIIFN